MSVIGHSNWLVPSAQQFPTFKGPQGEKVGGSRAIAGTLCVTLPRVERGPPVFQ